MIHSDDLIFFFLHVTSLLLNIFFKELRDSYTTLWIFLRYNKKIEYIMSQSYKTS